jgi:hypothetical protein
MNTIAWDFQAHCRAGLLLVGQNENGEPEWEGTDQQWDSYEKIAQSL